MKDTNEIESMRQQIKDITERYNVRKELSDHLSQQLAASLAREQQLLEKVSELINAAPGHAGQCSGLKCREPYCYSCNDEYEADEYLQQVWDLCHSARELLKQTDTTALSAMIAKAGIKYFISGAEYAYSSISGGDGMTITEKEAEEAILANMDGMK